MTEKTNEDKQTLKLPFDPLALLKEMQETQMQDWAKIMSESVGSEEFAQAMGQSVDSYLEGSAPIRQQFEKTMGQYLQRMNMPTHDEVVTMAERLTNLELRVDDVDAKLDQVLERLKAIQQIAEFGWRNGE